jgi:hypothetical protein
MTSPPPGQRPGDAFPRFGAGRGVERATLLDEILPDYDVYELHDIYLPAPPDEVEQALASVTSRELRLLGPLMALRKLPARLVGRGVKGDRPQQSLFEDLVRSGFLRLGERPGREIVFGVVGRFWSLTQNAPVTGLRGRDDFCAFDRPGNARAAMSFLIRREGRGSRLITETRIATTDAASRRSFGRYWRVIRLGSGAIRRSWLAAVRRRLASRSMA